MTSPRVVNDFIETLDNDVIGTLVNDVIGIPSGAVIGTPFDDATHWYFNRDDSCWHYWAGYWRRHENTRRWIHSLILRYCLNISNTIVLVFWNNIYVQHVYTSADTVSNWAFFDFLQNQQNKLCNSCWAIAAAGAVEILLSQAAKTPIKISTQGECTEQKHTHPNIRTFFPDELRVNFEPFSTWINWSKLCNWERHFLAQFKNNVNAIFHVQFHLCI